MPRKIKVTDAATGKSIEIDADSIKSGPIRNRSLPDDLLQRVQVVHEAIRDVLDMTLEQFEITFMRDSDPIAEVDLWERIVVGYKRTMAEMPDLDRKKVLRVLLGYSMDGLDEKEQADPVVKRILKVAQRE